MLNFTNILISLITLLFIQETVYILPEQVLPEHSGCSGSSLETTCSGCLCLQFVCAFPADLFSDIGSGHYSTDQCRWPRSGPISS